MTEPNLVLVLGGTSDIGRAVALRYAKAGWRIVLTARRPEDAARDAADIATRTGAPVSVEALDVLDPDLAAFPERLGEVPHTVVCVIGLLGDQPRAERDPDHARAILRTNLEGPAILLGAFAERFAARGTGAIVAVSSVAGDRGRASNYLYGSAKAGLTAFLSGLRNRFGRTGIRVVTVRPGFVRTRMTAGMKLPGPLTAAPEEVAERIFRAAEEGRGEDIYVRPIWRLVMAVIRNLPEATFKKTKL